jgi:hypothetical protein
MTGTASRSPTIRQLRCAFAQHRPNWVADNTPTGEPSFTTTRYCSLRDRSRFQAQLAGTIQDMVPILLFMMSSRRIFVVPSRFLIVALVFQRKPGNLDPETFRIPRKLGAKPMRNACCLRPVVEDADTVGPPSSEPPSRPSPIRPVLPPHIVGLGAAARIPSKPAPWAPVFRGNQAQARAIHARHVLKPAPMTEHFP